MTQYTTIKWANPTTYGAKVAVIGKTDYALSNSLGEKYPSPSRTTSQYKSNNYKWLVGNNVISAVEKRSRNERNKNSSKLIRGAKNMTIQRSDSLSDHPRTYLLVQLCKQVSVNTHVNPFEIADKLVFLYVWTHPNHRGGTRPAHRLSQNESATRWLEIRPHKNRNSPI